MSNKGYQLESELESFFLLFTNQTKKDSLFKDGKINRSFRVPNSGAMAALAGDVRTCLPFLKKQFMVECKGRTQSTKKGGKIYRLKYEWLQKNEKEADEEGLMPIHALSFKGTKKSRVWVIFRKRDLKEFIPLSFDIIPLGLSMQKEKGKSLTLQKNFLDGYAERRVRIVGFDLKNIEYAIIPLQVFKVYLTALKTGNMLGEIIKGDDL